MLMWEPKFARNDSAGAWWLLVGGAAFIVAFWVRAWINGALG